MNNEKMRRGHPTTEPTTEFMAWMHMYLVIRNLSMDDVAKLLRTTKQSISNWYRNEQHVPFVAVLGLCYAFNAKETPDEVYAMIK